MKKLKIYLSTLLFGASSLSFGAVINVNNLAVSGVVNQVMIPGGLSIGETFLPTVSGQLNSITLNIQAVAGTQVAIQIASTAGGLPLNAGGVIASTVYTIPTSARASRSITFSTPAVLTAGTTYSICLVGGTGNVTWFQNAANSYASGQACAHAGVWTPSGAGDFFFATYMTNQASGLVGGDQIINDLYGSFYAVGVSGATDYQWVVNGLSTSYSITVLRGSGYAPIPKTFFTGLQYGQTYTIQVNAKVGGSFVTGATHTISINPSSTNCTTNCGVPQNLSGAFTCVFVYGATDYEWLFQDASTSAVVCDVKRGGAYNTINKSMCTGLVNGGNYVVTVKAKAGGAFGNYGGMCNIIIDTSIPFVTEGSDLRSMETATIQNEAVLNLAPNPSDNNGFNISIGNLVAGDHNITINVFDAYGKMISSQVVTGAEQVVRMNGDGSLAKGLYFVTANVDGKVLNQKAIVK